MKQTLIPAYENDIVRKGYQSYIKNIGPLACDRYALTMTYAAWKLGFVEERKTTSNVFCRSLLNNGETYKDGESDDVKQVKIPYLINAGLGLVAEWYSGWTWKRDDLHHLAQQSVDDGRGNAIRLFPNEFLYWLSKQKLTLDINAIPEGQLLFPQEPSMRLTGPWWQQMLVEASTLELISSSTNLATVATQVRLAAQREARNEGTSLVEVSAKESATLAEMALRRSPSIGALQSARAAAIAGWNSTSNDYASKCYGIPAMGTFAHAWVMLHDTEEEAFENWAKVFPGATIFLADTYNTVEGVKTAIRVCKKHGLKLKGIRLDSGNLAYLSREAHVLLKEAGFGEAKILATDSISVKAAASLFGQVATEVTQRDSYVDVFGIGSTVAVNRDNPLHDFVLKLAARHDIPDGKEEMIRALIKLSENEKKTTLPGMIDVIRYVDKDGKWARDTIIPADLALGTGRLARTVYSESMQTGRVVAFPAGARFERLLKPWMKAGKMVDESYKRHDAAAILCQSRATCAKALSMFDRDHLLIPPYMPHSYGVGLAEELSNARRQLVMHIAADRNLERQKRRFDLQ